jgi:hypothetical protein
MVAIAIRASTNERPRKGGPAGAAEPQPPDGLPRPIVRILWHCSRNRTPRSPTGSGAPGRMMVSPFTFYRGAAKMVAADLKTRRGQADRSTVRRCASLELRCVRIPRDPGSISTISMTLPPVRVRRRTLGGELTPPLATTATARSTHATRQSCPDGLWEAMSQFAEMSTMDIWWHHRLKPT